MLLEVVKFAGLEGDVMVRMQKAAPASGAPIGGGVPMIAPEPAYSTVPKRVPFSRFEIGFAEQAARKNIGLLVRGSDAMFFLMVRVYRRWGLIHVPCRRTNRGF